MEELMMDGMLTTKKKDKVLINGQKKTNPSQGFGRMAIRMEKEPKYMRMAKKEKAFGKMESTKSGLMSELQEYVYFN